MNTMLEILSNTMISLGILMLIMNTVLEYRSVKIYGDKPIWKYI